MQWMNKTRLSWLFAALTLAAGAYFLLTPSKQGLQQWSESPMPNRHDAEVMPLSQLLQHPDLVGKRLLEVELEREHGRMVYELEILDSNGRVYERYYDAVSGEPLNGKH